ncbi:MAG: hypothetical protein Q8N99_00595 [Nanoarchaeota archaeon]|nr:hypothetical protein [Nanoarchaeota archaeon]
MKSLENTGLNINEEKIKRAIFLKEKLKQLNFIYDLLGYSKENNQGLGFVVKTLKKLVYEGRIHEDQLWVINHYKNDLGYDFDNIFEKISLTIKHWNNEYKDILKEIKMDKEMSID